MSVEDALTEEAIRGFLFEKHLPLGQIEEWATEIMEIFREHRPTQSEERAEASRTVRRFTVKTSDVFDQPNRSWLPGCAVTVAPGSEVLVVLDP